MIDELTFFTDVWVHLCAPKIYVQVLAFSMFEYNLIWKWIFEDIVKFRWGPSEVPQIWSFKPTQIYLLQFWKPEI